VSSQEFKTAGELETFRLGEALGAALELPAAVLLFGELGSGKTVLIRGLCQALGVPARSVRSPSFTIVNEYHGRCLVRHLDLYRLSGPADLAGIGFDELLETSPVLLVEWAERLELEIPGAILVRLAHAGEDARVVRLEGAPPLAVLGREAETDK